MTVKHDTAAIRRAQIEMRAKGKAQELPEDIEPYGESRALRLAGINERRKLHGLPPFVNDEDGNPELTEQRRKRSDEFWRGGKLRRANERPDVGPELPVRRHVS